MSRWVIIIVSISFITALILYYAVTAKEGIVSEWVTYAGSDSGVEGYLYELTSPDNQYGVYISVDKVVGTEAVQLADGWSLSQVVKGELWNPRVCAKMPVTIAEGGDVFMYETERRSVGQFSAKLIWFEKSSETIKETPFPFGEFIGRYLFTDTKNQPYFIALQNQVLSKHVIRATAEEIQQVPLRTMEAHERATLELREHNQPIIKRFNTHTLLSDYFALLGDELVAVEEIPESSIWRRDGDIYTLYGLGYSFEARYRPDGPYETAVLIDGRSVLSFKPEYKVYSYIIGAYQK